MKNLLIMCLVCLSRNNVCCMCVNACVCACVYYVCM